MLTLGRDLNHASLVTILVHGRGASATDMRSLANALALPDVRFIMPSAPGGTWYPQSFLAPTIQNEPFLSQALDVIRDIVDHSMSAGVPAERIVVGGFSQGACLTATFLLRHPKRYGGALILTGGLIGPPGTNWSPQPALAGTPVYLSGSRTDQWIPVARAEATINVLRASGAEVKADIFDDRPHAVARQEIEAARNLLIAAGAAASAPAPAQQ